MDRAPDLRVLDELRPSADAGARLRHFHSLIAPQLPGVARELVGALTRLGSASAGAPSDDSALLVWLEAALLGPHDAETVTARAREGAASVERGLDEVALVATVGLARSRLTELALDELAADAAGPGPTLQALGLALDQALAAMLGASRARALERSRVDERIAAVGQVAASIGHELRNPLGVIDSSLSLIRRQLTRAGALDGAVVTLLDKIEVEVVISGRIITNLLDLARNRPPRRQQVDVAALVEHAIELAALGPGVQLRWEVEPGLSLSGDPDQICGVVTNLLVNAGDAMGGAGGVCLRACRDDGGLAITVEDEGPGIPPEDAERIFDALFTTKSKGTGLGLALGRRVAAAHGGLLVFERPARGARFRLWLPDA